MLTDAPTVVYDVEFSFTSGAKEYVQATVGRDLIDLESDPKRLVIHHEDGAVETVEVYRAALACQRTAVRTLEPDASPDAVIGRHLGAVDA